MLLPLLLLAAQSPAADVAPRPNVVVVLTDDQRFDQLGCAGHPTLVTPHMDALAARGVRFTHAFVTTPICAASRASLLTGRREGRHGYTFGTPPMGLDLARESLPAQLRAVGYRTAFVGKWGVRFEKGAREVMFDDFRTRSLPYYKGDSAHLTTRIGDEAVEFVESATEDEPFFLLMSTWAPHAEDGHPDQYLPAHEDAALYAHAPVPVPPLAESGFAALPPFLKESLGRRRWTWRFDDREKQVRMTRNYWALITGADRALGRVMGTLHERGMMDNTIVVFTGDNGYFLGERGLAGKWFGYEESLRVPLIVVDPRAEGSFTRDDMVLNTDIAPTICELVGVDVPAGYDGRSLAPLLAGEAVDWRTDFLFEQRFKHAEIPVSCGVRSASFTYALYDGIEPPYEQLFDLEADPQQLVNLASDVAYEADLARMRARCEELRQE